jgi:murein DD-endopeptidase MepM/ murein hydrolase activator NlpD
MGHEWNFIGPRTGMRLADRNLQGASIMKTLLVSAAAALAFAGTAAAQDLAAPMQATSGLEVRFCPETVARTYPLDTVRSMQGLLLQNVVVINHGAPVKLEAIEIALMRGTDAVDSRLISGAALENAVKGGQAVQGSGMLEVASFQFCDGRLLNGAKLADDLTLETGEAVIIMQQPFTWKGARDAVRVSARSLRGEEPVAGRASIPIDGTTSKTQFRFPLKSGTWLVGAGASFHTTHRWAVPEEFALDIIQIGPNFRSHRTDGVAHTDFFAYGAEVVAAADGKVIQVITGAVENPPMLPKPGEAMDSYYGRIGAQQASNLAGGLPGLMGEGVVIDHGNGEYSVYAHLKPGSVTVRVGQTVKSGETIGLLGSSGNSTEAHLHFQVCDKPAALACAAIVPSFVGFEIANSDGPRPLQSGDLVSVP